MQPKIDISNTTLSKPSARPAKTMQDKTRSEDAVSPRTSQHTASLLSDSEYRYNHVDCIEWLPTRPGHVTLSISFVALIVAVMSTQHCSSAPCLGQPINGATHTAGNREMGLKVSHDQYRGIVESFQLCLLQSAAVLAAGSRQCSAV
jgi:hypothetical protein